MWDITRAVTQLNSQALPPFGNQQCAHFVKRAISAGGIPFNAPITSAKDYGPALLAAGFQPVVDVTSVQAGDVIVIQAASNHPHGHMAMYNGTKWVSDYVQERGYYPAQPYRNENTAFVIYRYGESAEANNNTSSTTQKPAPMKVVYPITKNKKGEEFSYETTDSILNQLSRQPEGSYILGRNNMWHGGIHITSLAADWCSVNNKMYPGNDPAQPIRCMADGEIIAFRLNKAYPEAPWGSKKLKFSSTFVLVKHHFIPPEEKHTENSEETSEPSTDAGELTFYSLYMHMAPLSDYLTGERAYQTAGRLNGYYSNKNLQKPDVPVEKGTGLLWDPEDKERTATPKTGKNKNRIYGLVTITDLPESKTETRLKVGDKIWLVVDKDNVTPLQSGLELPPWLKEWKSVNNREPDFDKVVAVTPSIKIEAGQAVGFMGFNPLPFTGGVSEAHRVHIEVFTDDNRIETFITNPLKLKGGRQFASCTPGKDRYMKIDEKTFTLQEKKSEYSGIVPLSAANRTTVKASGEQPAIEYCEIKPEAAWIRATDLEILSQYDLKKLGFYLLDGCHQMLEHLPNHEKPTGFIRDILEYLHERADHGTWIYRSLLAENCQHRINQLSCMKLGEPYEPNEFRKNIQHGYFRDDINKIIAKHPSEWYDKSTDPLWENMMQKFAKYRTNFVKFNSTVIDACVWMQELPEFAGKKEYWYMHPIVFLWYLKNHRISLEEARVRAFMRVIRVCEGTDDNAGYERLFGGESFIKDYNKTFDDHPRKIIKRENKKTKVSYSSSAAGAYQVLGWVWDDKPTIRWRKKYNIDSFTPESQDKLCFIFLKEKAKEQLVTTNPAGKSTTKINSDINALDLILSGEIIRAITNCCSYEWASMPPGRYGQPKKSIEFCMEKFETFLNDELNDITTLYFSNDFIKDVRNV